MTATAKRIEQEIREPPLENKLVLHYQLVTSIHEQVKAAPGLENLTQPRPPKLRLE